MRSHLILALLLLSFTAKAQSVKLISATHTSWSGGVAGRHGDNYDIILELSKCSTQPLPDTIWIDNQRLPLTIGAAGQQGNFNARLTHTKGKYRYEITVGTTHDEYVIPGVKEPEECKPPVKCNGIALLGYSYKGRQHYYTITHITKHTAPIAYP
jgi:hypothetical protein